MAITIQLPGDNSSYKLTAEAQRDAVVTELLAIMKTHAAGSFDLDDGSTLVVNGSAVSHARVIDSHEPSSTVPRV